MSTSNDGYSPPPSVSDTYSRSPSIDPTNHVSYAPQAAAPNISSVLNGNSDSQFSATSQWSLPQDQFIDQPPVLSDARPVVNSRNEMSEFSSTRGQDSSRSSGHAPGLTDLGHINMSVDGGDVTSETRPPTMTDFAERERSNNNGEPDDPQAYEGMSIVGKQYFKDVDPEEYDIMEEDDLLFLKRQFSL